MRQLDDYYAWFRAEAENLAGDARQSVLAALQNQQPLTVHRDLYDLFEAKKLPESWEDNLRSFWDFYCH